MRYRMFSGIPGLQTLDASTISSVLSSDNLKCLQTKPSIPWRVQLRQFRTTGLPHFFYLFMSVSPNWDLRSLSTTPLLCSVLDPQCL